MPSSRPASTMSPVALRAIDWVFFVFAGLAAVWMAWMFVRQSFAFGWWQLLFLVVFWVALAYLVLPRLHRILTAIYVPYLHDLVEGVRYVLTHGFVRWLLALYAIVFTRAPTSRPRR